MAKKRTTLPKDFKEILERNDLDELKAVFDGCDINAYERDSRKTPALCMYGISEEFIEWLVRHGADTEAANSYGRTALHIHAGVNQRGKVKKLLELGANIHAKDCYGNTALHSAGHRFETVKLLLEHGADPRVENDRGETPLLSLLSRCNNADIASAARTAELLLQAGDRVTEAARKQVARIGESFEFYRKDFASDLLGETDRGLQRLYALFEVKPAARRIMHDGTSPIHVSADTWQRQFEELWELLVPGRGHAQTVQGEVIRICGKVSREILDNGAANWSREYKKLPQVLPGYFAMGNPIGKQSGDTSLLHRVFKKNDNDEDQEAVALARSIGADSDEATLDRLCQLAVKWVLANPLPIQLDKVNYTR